MLNNLVRYTCFVLFCIVALNSCGKKESRETTSSSLLEETPMVSPHKVHIGELAFYQSYDEVTKRVRKLTCSTNYLGDKVCYWRASKGDRSRRFENTDQIIFTFVRDTLHEMKMEYLTMFDVEFTNFLSIFKQTFGSPTVAGSSDSLQMEWHSDSLSIILVPNKRLHWTKSVYTFTPVIDYQERILRKQ
ncbi:MAG TPA: hypothetical protein VKI62_08465 [Bacteroidota bacterium]|nr:hypothetical protein [Bacteroidota bacterium]